MHNYIVLYEFVSTLYEPGEHPVTQTCRVQCTSEEDARDMCARWVLKNNDVASVRVIRVTEVN